MTQQSDFTFAHRDEGFDNHIDHSIRHYNTLHDDIVSLSRNFVENGTNIIDIGCSTGKTLHAMVKQNDSFAPDATYIGIENAIGFKADMQNRMQENPRLDLRFEDIRSFNFENCNLITSIFTLQFMPRVDRRNVLTRIYNGLNPGGAFIFAEKTFSENARLQELLTFQYYDYKRQHFTCEDIMNKEVTLRNMLKPNTWNELKSMLATAGFSFENVQPFWQNHLFMGVIALKY